MILDIAAELNYTAAVKVHSGAGRSADCPTGIPESPVL